ncbi:hypothetical protein, partial [Sutterella wadsworthensis]|uniref:hypothetical protein n=1 Tax=Sutterella wadsworthensis TaxID=40545 RepID=UPI00242EE746
NIGSILAEKRNPVKTYWFIFTGLAQQNIRSLTLITRVRDLLSGSSGFMILGQPKHRLSCGAADEL